MAQKNIKLEMKDNKDIGISVNNNEQIIIKKEVRNIKAEEIFNLLDYSKGDIFSVSIENKKNYDGPVITFFQELIEEITKKITEEFRECKETDGVEDLF